MRRSTDHIRVSVQLADASNGALLWSARYDAEPKGIFSIQDNITRQVVGALAVKLTKLEPGARVGKATEQPRSLRPRPARTSVDGSPDAISEH